MGGNLLDPCGFSGQLLWAVGKTQRPEQHRTPWYTSWSFLQRAVWLLLCSGSPGVGVCPRGGVHAIWAMGAERAVDIDCREFENEHQERLGGPVG